MSYDEDDDDVLYLAIVKTVENASRLDADGDPLEDILQYAGDLSKPSLAVLRSVVWMLTGIEIDDALKQDVKNHPEKYANCGWAQHLIPKGMTGEAT
jgi:hypothetical protein